MAITEHVTCCSIAFNSRDRFMQEADVTRITYKRDEVHSGRELFCMSVVVCGKEDAMKPTDSTKRVERSALKLFFLLTLTAVVAFGGMPIIDKPQQRTVQLTGVVTDAVCGITHGTNGSDAECTRLCVSIGADFALGVGNRTYVLQGHRAELNRFAGDRVMVKGKFVKADTIAVEDVIPSVIWASSRQRT
jgi:hypothetical protein